MIGIYIIFDISLVSLKKISIIYLNLKVKNIYIYNFNQNQNNFNQNQNFIKTIVYTLYALIRLKERNASRYSLHFYL